MSKTNFTIKTKKYTHINYTDRQNIERWLSEGKSQAEIARLLNRSPSTISREMKRGTTRQIKQINGYDREVKVYYADTAQARYDKNRQKCKSKGLEAFSPRYWEALREANNQKLFSGKNRKYNIKTFTVIYQRENPLENIPTFKTVYNYIHRGDFFIKPIDLPVMVRLEPRKNKNSQPKGTNKKKYGRSISERPDSVLQREEFGHWEADLVEGKKGKNEPVILTLVERYTRYAISKKLKDSKSETVNQALKDIVQADYKIFDTITFDNGSEFSQVAKLEKEGRNKLKIYFCHAYSAWERGTNENFNKLLREFVPKGKSFHEFTATDIEEAAQSINQRIREVNDYQSAEELFNKVTA